MSPPDHIACDSLDTPHLEALSRAVFNLIETDLALTTYAQLIDGLPISNIVRDTYSTQLHPQHPIDDHVALCPGALNKAKELRAGFKLNILRFSPLLLQAYQSAPIPSRAFKLRLIEMAAVTLHQIGVWLFQLNLRMHDPATTRDSDIETITKWEPDDYPFFRIAPFATLFNHINFRASTQYPDGLADVAGYWAENRVLGGVVSFDRSQSWTADNEPNVWFQCSRWRITYRVCQLLDEQQEALLGFLQKRDVSQDECPLPILPDSNNRARIEPDESIPVHKVYRDSWERPTLERLTPLQRKGRKRDVRNSLDFPEIEDLMEELRKRRRG
ncbi:hypothetical protein F4678DRAFT_481866 [Xylaria arbuscula]|nr:hypothetical protein F4678DRAFT_481866 [Xylaria arbuscula]